MSLAHKVTMLKPSLSPHFHLHVTPRVTAIVTGVAWGVLTVWTVAFNRRAGVVIPPGSLLDVWTWRSGPCDWAAFPKRWF